VEWSDFRPDLTGRPVELRAAFDEALAHAADRSRPFTLLDGLACSLLAGKFRAEAWSALTVEERQAYMQRIGEMARQARERLPRRHEQGRHVV
jgi:hypothetical protein